MDLMTRIYRCPETHQPLEELDETRLSEINEAIRAGELLDHAGATVQQILDAGLMRDDGTCVYPVRDGVPNLLVDDRIALSKQA
jgi:uncharacterized protein YbaR (Trm112 family)